MNPVAAILRDLAASMAKETLRRAADEWQRIETPQAQQAERPEDAKRQLSTPPSAAVRGSGAVERRDPRSQAGFHPSPGTPERRTTVPSKTPAEGARAEPSLFEQAQPRPALPAAAEGRIASVERIVINAGPLAATQELQAVLRTLPPGMAGAFLAHARPSLGAIVEHLCERPAVADKGSDTRDAGKAQATGAEVATTTGGFGSAAITRTLASVAVMLDAGAGSPEVRSLARDLGAIFLSGKNANDNAIFFGLAQAVAIGAGLLLPLSIAEQLEERGERRRRQGLIAILAASLARLRDRIDGAHDEVIEIAGPLTFEWAAWCGELGDEDIAAALFAYLSARPGLLESLADRLSRLERAGRDAVRILTDLSLAPADDALRQAQSALLGSRATEVAIAGSLTARREILLLAGARQAPLPTGPTLDAVQMIFTDIGFPVDRAAFLADAALSSPGHLPLGSGWTRLDSLGAVREGGRAFQQLLAFLNGRFVVPAPIDLVDLADLDRNRPG